MDFAQVSKIRLEGKPYDAEVEYLEGTGTQYIDTGIYPADGLSFDLNAALMTDSSSLTHSLFGGRNRMGGSDGLCSWWNTADFYFYGWGNNNDSGGRVTRNFTVGTQYAFHVDKTGITIDGTRQTTFTRQTAPTETDYPIYLFNSNNGGALDTRVGDFRVYGFTIKNNGVIVRDFHPVRKNGVGYLYDKISSQLFGNAGTGAFLYGSDTRCYSVAKIERDTLPGKPYDHRVEYIETTPSGGQYIETGLYLQSGDTVSMRASSSGSSNQCFWSARSISGNVSYNTFTLFYLKYISPNQGRFDYGLDGATQGGALNVFNDFSGWSGVHEYKAVANKLYIDGTLYVTGMEAQFTTGGAVRLLASESATTAGTFTNFFVGKVYGFKVIRNGKTIMDLVPVRKNGVGCLYDLVSKTLFQNAGTETLSYGSDVPEVLWKKRPYDAEVEYLESNGTQYIDTGLNYFPEYEIGAVVPGAVGNNTLGIGQTWKLGRDKADNPVWRATINYVSYPTGVSCGTYADMSYHGTAFRCNSETIVVPANQYASGTMVLFSTGENIPTAYPLKLYYCRLFDANGVLVRDFIPVRLGTTGYLYDKVSGQLFGNAGTGSFVYGADLEG